jgi:hypothetical protein
MTLTTTTIASLQVMSFFMSTDTAQEELGGYLPKILKTIQDKHTKTKTKLVKGRRTAAQLQPGTRLWLTKNTQNQTDSLN